MGWVFLYSWFMNAKFKLFSKTLLKRLKSNLFLCLSLLMVLILKLPVFVVAWLLGSCWHRISFTLQKCQIVCTCGTFLWPCLVTRLLAKPVYTLWSVFKQREMMHFPRNFAYWTFWDIHNTSPFIITIIATMLYTRCITIIGPFRRAYIKNPVVVLILALRLLALGSIT